MSEDKDLSLWIMIGIIIIITIYLTIVYITLRLSLKKNNSSQTNINIRSYPCYLNIILSMVIAVNNICRLITTKKQESFACQLQAFILACFDKLIATTITANSFLTYEGLCDNDYYIAHIKPLFIITNSIGLLISIVFALIFTIRGTNYFKVCYILGGPKKEIPDTILTSILFILYLYFTLKSILFLAKNMKELSLKSVEKKYIRTFTFHYFRMSISLILCSAFFIVTILIINDSLFFGYDYIDITFITLCLIIDLFFTLNQTVIKQTLKCFNKQTEEEDDNENFVDDNEEEDNNQKFNSIKYM
jgi:hypothetical protein